MPNKSTTQRYVAYYRVSTERQGRSGLGLDAQRAAVKAFISRPGGTLRAEFTEVQSGKLDRRPQLDEALALCNLTNATLLIAKLDRLSRNVAFLATLQQSHTKFVACDLPQANELVVHILAAVAQAERKTISERTKAALAAARIRGVKLGNPFLKPGTAARAQVARQFRGKLVEKRMSEVAGVIANAERNGCNTLRKIADHLNQLDVTTPQGARWHANSVRRIRQRTNHGADS